MQTNPNLSQTAAKTIDPQNWSTFQKIAFRFFFVFFIVYVFINPNGIIPNANGFVEFYLHPLVVFIPWLAKHLLHTTIRVDAYENDSGDRAFDYLVYLLVIIVAAVACIIWSVTGRKTRNYNKLLYWVYVVVRYYAGFTMLTYGGVKVIKLQFAAPNPMRLLEPVGNLSPFVLAWTYMGHSVGFNYFAGIAEITCGMLMFWRRTTTLGAIMGFVVAGNIVAINYCFDVPVKLLSTTLTLMFTFLLVKDSRRLLNVLITNRTALPADLSPHRFKAKWKNITLTTLKYVLIIYVITGTTYQLLQADKYYGDNSKKPPLYGIYNVQYFIRNKDTLLPLTTDTSRWRTLMINKFDNGAIKTMNDTVKYYAIKDDSVKHLLIVHTFADTLHKFTFKYTVAKPDILLLKGTWQKDSVKVKLVKYDLKKFTLLNRDFHWINEHGFAR